MPAYNALVPPPAAYPGDKVMLFNAESTATITTSQQVYLTSDIGTGVVECLIEGFFSGAPGTFEIDIQFAATDTDKAYITPALGGAITAANSNNYFSYKYDPTLGPFVRALMKTNGNTVNLTLSVLR